MNKTGMKIFKKALAITLFFALLSGLGIGYWNYQKASADFKETQLSTIKNAAQISVLTLDGKEVEAVGKDKSAAAKVLGKLRKIRETMSLQTNAVKILREKGNLSEIVISDRDQGSLGKNYDLVKEMSSAIKSGKATARISEKGGKDYAAGFAPFKSDSSNAVFLLMLEKDVSHFKPALISTFGVPVAVVLILFIIALFLLFFDSKKLQSSIDSAVNYLNKIQKGESASVSDYSSYCSELTEPLKFLQEKIASQKVSEFEQEKIQSQIKDLLKNVSAAANGDFTVQAKVTADTLGALADSFNLMVSDLSELIRDVKKAATKVNTATENILHNTNAMAEGAENQAAQTEGITKSSKDMVNLLNKTNENAQRAAEAANKAKEIAERGGEIVKKSVDGMRIIRDSVQEASKQVKQLGDNSKQISEITDFIVEIANRTNLLALNASIEAARAGEAGRGFTVVADEIRNLAERSSKSAEEISELVEDIQNGIIKSVEAMESGTSKVSEGTELVDSAGEILKEILGSVEISSSSIIDISKATHEQTEFSENIAKSLEEIAEIAKKTAERSKQSIESVTELEFLSKTLNQTVEKFKLAQ